MLSKEAKKILKIGTVKFQRKINARSKKAGKISLEDLETGHVATLVKVHKKVDLLTAPSKEIKGDGVHVKFLDRYYKYRMAKVGERLRNGDVIRTAVNGFARIIFNNGDQINIAPGSSYKIVWGDIAKEYKTSSPSLYLLYGKIRAIFETDGPRKSIKLRSKNASMGIRGTDFFVDSKTMIEGSTLLVIRGKVAITNYKTQETIEVGRGYHAKITVEAPRETKDLILQSFDEEDLAQLEHMVESMKITLNIEK